MSLEDKRPLLSSEEFKIFRKYLEKMRGEVLESWALGLYVAESQSGTIQMNAKQLGVVEVLDKLLSPELTYREIVEYVNE